MNLIAQLMSRTGVVAAGHYALRGDRYQCKGPLSGEQGRLLALICRTTSSGVGSQSQLAATTGDGGQHLAPLRGWILRGPGAALCVVDDHFCWVRHGHGLDDVVAVLKGSAPQGAPDGTPEDRP